MLGKNKQDEEEEAEEEERKKKKKKKRVKKQEEEEEEEVKEEKRREQVRLVGEEVDWKKMGRNGKLWIGAVFTKYGAGDEEGRRTRTEGKGKVSPQKK